MPASAPLRPISRIAGLVLVPLLLAACGDRAQPEPADNAGADRAAARASTDSGARTSNEDPRPTITPHLLDAYIRGMEEEIALMRATAERDAVQARLGTLRALYDRYMEIAAIGD